MRAPTSIDIKLNYASQITTAPLDQNGKVCEGLEDLLFFTLTDMNQFIQIFDARHDYGQFMQLRLYYGFIVDADTCKLWRQRMTEFVVYTFIEQCREVPYPYARFIAFLAMCSITHGFKVI